MATLTVSPTSGAFGTTITLTGTGFAISTAITITWDGFEPVTTPTTITSDGSGGFSATVLPPNYVFGDHTIIASDGTSTASGSFELLRKPTYCTVGDVADRLRIDIDANSDPNTTMVEEFIMENEDDMDSDMLHTFLPERQVTETFDVNRSWDWGRGLPLFPRHRNIRDFDVTKGDKFEVWNGSGWQDQSTRRIYFETIKGTMYLKGYLFTILTRHRFRITYRYGRNNEMEAVPRDIKKCCILMTAINILETDFQMSQIPYGGEGNVDKDKLMDRYQKRIDNIIRKRSELVTVW